MSNITLKTVNMKDGSQKAKLIADYNADLVKRCRQLGGSWNNESKAWYFPTDLLPQLRQVCQEIFGIDPLAETPADLVNVQFALNYSYDTTSKSSSAFWLFGRELLYRPGRDNAVKPGDGVSILSGGFRPTGGSARYPSLSEAQEGTTLLVRDVPRPMAEAFKAEHPEDVITIIEREEPKSVAVEQAKAAATTLAGLLKKLGKDDQDLVIAQLVASLEEKQTI